MLGTLDCSTEQASTVVLDLVAVVPEPIEPEPQTDDEDGADQTEDTENDEGEESTEPEEDQNTLPYFE